ncbi:GAF and ANTAR domain-containing protein [Virgisporangium aurantiacum]|uniref:GAF domain-containing protein n=1 Tax=Virgisporangium aurantiacum TaxID=175570 RepID=A0A8J3Z3P9_9ACTN|nr:GAF and ANTAR domain-containing protein [Virgisporangium aurantiacum]GIJ57034.1 GAF domain-containing protein [Virgisporangium aurantiacum]
MDDPLPAGRPAVEDVTGQLRAICGTAARVLSASGVGLSVMATDGTYGMATASDPATERIEELQFTYGEGPCVDAFASCRPVLVPDLAADAMCRWPIYAPAIHDAGVRAVFAFPLQIGAVRLGALDVFRVRSGSLSRTELGEAFTFADRAVTTLLDGQERATDDADGLDDALDNRIDLFQAQGMVMVQLGVGLAEALTRIRAYAYAQDRRLSDVAVDIVARRLHFDRDPT